MKAPILISIISALIAFSSMLVSIWYSKRALEQNKRHRADSLKQATFSKVLEGFQEIMQVISELLSKRDYVRNALATNEYGKAQKEVEDNLNDLDVLKWKWISLLPNQFINECDKFRLVYKNWMVAERNINSEGKEQVSKLSNSLDNSRTELIKMIREIVPTKYLYKSVTGIIDEDRDK